MRTNRTLRRPGETMVTTMDDLASALAKVLDAAEPVEAIEVSLTEAVGLVLAEPAVADVDLPPFDRAASAGYAVRSIEATPGTLLRVVRSWSDDGHEVEPGEAARVGPGEAMPLGADAVLGLDEVRAEGGSGGPPRFVEPLRAVEPGRSVVRRGATLADGATLFEAGTRLRPAMVGLLATQGVTHPTCHRRVRVAILAVGDHLVGPADPPVLHHERNASNLAVGALLLDLGAMTHDLGSVAEADFAPALDRALNAPVVLILGPITGPTRRALARAGVEPVVSGLALDPAGPEVGHGVARDDDGRVVSHVVHLPLDPVAAVVAATLLVLPLVARLQGDVNPVRPPIPAHWDGEPPAPSHQTRAVLATLRPDPSGRLVARPVSPGRPSTLPDLARADGLALFPPHPAGALVGVIPFSARPPFADA